MHEDRCGGEERPTVLIGVPKEIKDHEYRVGLTPESVRTLVTHGHRLLVEHDAGAEVGFGNDSYLEAGAEVVRDVADVYDAEMVVKVKEPQGDEVNLLRKEQILFSYLHLVADPGMTAALMRSGATCIAYEMITAPDGSRPLLIPMSAIAGRLAIQVGAHYLERPHGRRGLLLGGAPGAAPAKVAVLGAGTVGVCAAEIALGMQAEAFVLDKSDRALQRVRKQLGDGVVSVLTSDGEDFKRHLVDADLVVGALLVPGGRTPQVADRSTVAGMKPGAVIVDVSADQGGCFETSRPTTHSRPTYVEENVVHYCVTNMPGIVPLTSTLSLNHATLAYAVSISGGGWRRSLRDDPGLAEGLSVCDGAITSRQAAADLGLDYRNPRTFL